MPPLGPSPACGHAREQVTVAPFHKPHPVFARRELYRKRGSDALLEGLLEYWLICLRQGLRAIVMFDIKDEREE